MLTPSFDVIPSLSDDPEVLRRIQASVDVLTDHLDRGYWVYGVNTGFGGSADLRTDNVAALQASLMQLTQCGVLTPRDLQHPSSTPEDANNAMPASWVRASIVVRCNATVRGHSAVSLKTLRAVFRLMEYRLTPVVPLRGTVSASGDLMPLAYIAGAIEGSPGIHVELSDGKVLSAKEALELQGLRPVILGPKEGLGLVNGTAPSAALGALVLYRAHQQSVLVQALTALAVEALEGSAESFDPFISAVRPHPGQIEVSRNIHSFLQGSRLARCVWEAKEKRPEDLIQDRYSLRSAPQWIGPQLEDLMLAHRQISTELNSSCDNPLVNSAGKEGSILYGCNFQAASVTSAVEKVRLSLQMYGRLLFSQLTEMVDPALSGGLPANLAADGASLSFTCKGLDIAMAAYMSELSYLANPLSPHVQPAEMHNQSVNSMALASARLSMQAADILSLMCANHLYTCCQALDLRVLHRLFTTAVQAALRNLALAHFSHAISKPKLAQMIEAIEAHVTRDWKRSSKSDIEDRCHQLAWTLPSVMLDYAPEVTTSLVAFRDDAGLVVSESWRRVSDSFKRHQPTEEYLGVASKVLYHWVREELRVPFHQGFVEHPTNSCDALDERPKKTIGAWVSLIHAAIIGGEADRVLMELVRDRVPVSLPNETAEARRRSTPSRCKVGGTPKRASPHP